MMRIALITTAFLAFASPSASQAPDPGEMRLTITRDQARTLPAQDAADLVFRQLASRMQSMTRPSERGGELMSLTFATAPHWSGNPGICSATLVHAGMERPHNRNDLGSLGVVATELAYKVIGFLDMPAEWSASFTAEQERLCAAAGPVVAPQEKDFWRPYFFTVTGFQAVGAGAETLNLAIKGARSGSYADIGCDDRDPERGRDSPCSDPKALLASLDLANLTSMEISKRGENLVRVKADFAVSARSFWVVTTDAEFIATAGGTRGFRLGRTVIESGAIFDVEEPPPG